MRKQAGTLPEDMQLLRSGVCACDPRSPVYAPSRSAPSVCRRGEPTGAGGQGLRRAPAPRSDGARPGLQCAHLSSKNDQIFFFQSKILGIFRKYIKTSANGGGMEVGPDSTLQLLEAAKPSSRPSKA